MLGPPLLTSNAYNLNGKTALVTGGARGIGAAIVERLASEGAKVAFTYVSNAEAAETFAATVGPDALAIKADAADPAGRPPFTDPC